MNRLGADIASPPQPLISVFAAPPEECRPIVGGYETLGATKSDESLPDLELDTNRPRLLRGWRLAFALRELDLPRRELLPLRELFAMYVQPPAALAKRTVFLRELRALLRGARRELELLARRVLGALRVLRVAAPRRRELLFDDEPRRLALPLFALLLRPVPMPDATLTSL